MALFNLKSLNFSHLEAILTDLDPDPFSQYGSRSRGPISISTDPHGSVYGPDPNTAREYCKEYRAPNLKNNAFLYGS